MGSANLNHGHRIDRVLRETACSHTMSGEQLHSPLRSVADEIQLSRRQTESEASRWSFVKAEGTEEEKRRQMLWLHWLQQRIWTGLGFVYNSTTRCPVYQACISTAFDRSLPSTYQLVSLVSCILFIPEKWHERLCAGQCFFLKSLYPLTCFIVFACSKPLSSTFKHQVMLSHDADQFL